MRERRKRLDEPILKIRHVRFTKELIDGVQEHAQALSQVRRKRVTWSEAARELLEEALGRRRG